MLKTALLKKLKQRKQERLFRKRNIFSDAAFLSFSSNDYLGLAKHPKVVFSCKAGLKKYGVGGKASQLLGGYTLAHGALEEELAGFLGYERVLLFSTGYMANVGAITTLLSDNHNHIFVDRLCHASIIDGVCYTKKDYTRYKHLDVSDLEKLINRANTKYKSIISEGVFSMNGDIAPLPKLVAVAKQHNSWILLDDAHGIGVLGNKGKGTMDYHGVIPQEIQILVGTFGKAFGTFGAFIAGNKIIIESLLQFARTYIYTTTLPAAIVEATRTSLKLLQQETWRRDYLTSLVKKFKEKALELNLSFLPSSTPIQSIVINNIKYAENVMLRLKQKGILVALVRPPTVPINTTRLRISLTVEHSEKDVDCLLENLKICLESLTENCTQNK